MQKNWGVASVFVVAGFLRLYNLGYSDYQGDEIKALYNPTEATSVQFFLDQRKGPMQFLVTAGLKKLSANYQTRTLVRLPFALAGFGSVIIFYYLAKAFFPQRIAFYATIFFCTNGFLLAFSRLVQYQSLVIFFGLGAVYLTKKYADALRLPHHVVESTYLLIAAVSLALSILSHYDGIFFIPFILGILLPALASIVFPTRSVVASLRGNPASRHLIVSTLLFLTLTCAFYVPFALNIAQSTTSYWAGRISGDVSAKISSSRYLFSVYQPIYVLHIYTILGSIGFGLISLLTLTKLFPKLFGNLLAHMYQLNAFKAAHAFFRLPSLLAMLVWFLIPFILLEVVIYIPGTHIYAYLIPLFLFMGFAIFHIQLLTDKIFTFITHRLGQKGTLIPVSTFRFITPAGIYLLFAFLALQSYFVFVDHTYEYPWENKKFLIWTLPKPTPIFHLSMFGFPYYRYWDKIGNYIRTEQQAMFYTTNERVSISRYHIPLEKAGDKVGYYVYIKNPQTFTNEVTNIRIALWMQTNPPVVQYRNSNRVVSEIYLVK